MHNRNQCKLYLRYSDQCLFKANPSGLAFFGFFCSALSIIPANTCCLLLLCLFQNTIAATKTYMLLKYYKTM